MRHIFFDLFGVLAVPLPAPVLLERLNAAEIHVPPKTVPWVSRGFTMAMALENINETILSEIRDMHLSSDCPDLATLAEKAIARGLIAAMPTATRLADAERSLAIAVEGVQLQQGALEVVAASAAEGWTCHLASDVSTPFSTVVDRLGLRPSFERIWLSCSCGVRKRDAGAWATELNSLGALDENVVLVGDSWHGDVLPALAAGLGVIFVDSGGGHPARQLLKDITPLLSANCDGVEFRSEVEAAVELLVPGIGAALQNHPEDSVVEAADGTLGLAALASVTVVTDVRTVVDCLRGPK